jgi:hypothetical protein
LKRRAIHVIFEKKQNQLSSASKSHHQAIIIGEKGFQGMGPMFGQTKFIKDKCNSYFSVRIQELKREKPF